MNKIGGNRNYGYGKQLAWAGKNALADRYGQGHHSSRGSHAQRWQQFSLFAKSHGINDARKIDPALLARYALHLKTQVDQGEKSVAYAQNLLSTVNVVLATMRKDTVLNLKPAQWVGKRNHVRTSIPATLERDALARPIVKLEAKDQPHAALIAQLARSFGLRFKEASLLDCRKALREAKRLGNINITQGTKGGRGNEVDRWVPVSKQPMDLLKQAAKLQGKTRNLIPEDKTYKRWYDQAHNQWRAVNKETTIKGFHTMRAAYACERYEALTGFAAPVVAGKRLASKTVDQQARKILSQELGHGRTDVIAAYIGSSQ